ncbi:hypothetical protein [Bradyrhizobium sp.]|uniref:hypothetical protein n=1 Tax=Bradyrhizobium sp. TaxID=376 RepID=UPI0027333A70|nr:hypothetical protein [Bradyrhizobium sp.]MDP3690333.1 hypothetical protein [Bradyrhizobium sp.]
MKKMEPESDCQDTASTDLQVDSARREAIGKIGKFAAYTAPAMLAVLTGEARAQGASPPPT